MREMEFRVLGPLEVVADGRQLALGPTKQRALLALLLLRSNQTLTRDELIDALWGERAPGTAPNALHGYVSGLRKILGADRIETRSAGYALRADLEEIDLERFELLHARARALEPQAAADQLHEALALWHGRPLGDLDGAPFLDVERRRLDEIRLGAIEDRVEVELALGRNAELVPELDRLVSEQPLRERLRGQLMLALYRSGRQAEALEVYRQGRNLLAEDLGLEPGEQLKQLERGILEHDPALGPVSPLPATRPPSPGVRAPRRVRRGPLVAVVVGLLALAGVALALGVTLTRGSNVLLVRANSVAVVDPTTNKLVDDVPVGKRPAAISVGSGGVWVANADSRTVSRIDPRTRKVVDEIGVGTDVHDLAAGFGSVWVADGTNGTVTRIDPKTGVVETLPLGAHRPVFWVATGAGSVWATSGDVLLRIDPQTDRVVSRTEFFAQPTGLAAGSAIWVTTDDQKMLRYSPRHLSSSTGNFDLRAPGLAPTVGDGSVWVIVYSGRGVIQPVDAESLSLGPGTETSAIPLDVTVEKPAVWAVGVDGNVLRIDPDTAAVVATIPTAPTLRSAIAVGAGAVWVAMQGT